MKKLLNKTLLYYLILSSGVLILSGPCFYFLIEKLYLDDVNEAVLLRRDEFFKKNLPDLKIEEISVWNKFNRDTRILADTVTASKDQIILQIFYDEMVPEWEPYHVLYKNIQVQGKPFVLMIRLNLVESQDLMLTLTWLYLGTLFLLLLANFYITRLISSKLWHPFYDTLQKIEKFNLQHQQVPVFEKVNIIEFEKLNSAVSKLINDIVKAYQIQKEFTENASHELQNPLAIFRNKLDLLLQNTSLNTEQSEIIQSLYQVSGRLSRINKNLLLLSKIENKQFSDTERIDISTIFQQVIPYFKEQALAKNINIVFDKQTTKLYIIANKGLTEILINNLLLNAISHNKENGTVTIVLIDNSLEVCNTSANNALINDIL
ncbi:sensor histidine kinase [Albibacterium bauzanense]|uniref:histidine kinase n=1 Tax=Albibacterium bauzanense TaxID=653929 RepID=A0A4R1LW36_9SPHI|nr:HAMP domain-containing sensor histidine kinase [Albibacterium bauzanense]TCK83638.1 signal transduction histidine kinase [Albibacterium bauzanense]